MGTGDVGDSGALGRRWRQVLAWEDQKGKVWLSYNSAAYLQKRHGLKDEQAKSLGAVAALVQQTAAP
jgi:uncharacterized protein (DUF302 family)